MWAGFAFERTRSCEVHNRSVSEPWFGCCSPHRHRWIYCISRCSVCIHASGGPCLQHGVFLELQKSSKLRAIRSAVYAGEPVWSCRWCNGNTGVPAGRPAKEFTIFVAIVATSCCFYLLSVGKTIWCHYSIELVATVVSQVVNLRLAVDVPRKERRTTGKVGERRRNPMKMRRICATPRLGEERLKKMGIYEKTPEKEVESPREKGEPYYDSFTHHIRY